MKHSSEFCELELPSRGLCDHLLSTFIKQKGLVKGVENRNCLQLKPCHMSLNIRVGIMWDLLTSDIITVKVII